MMLQDKTFDTAIHWAKNKNIKIKILSLKTYGGNQKLV